MNIALYRRVSTSTQVQGESLADQENDGRAWAANNGHAVAAVFTDAGLSGTLPAADRPGLTAALESLKAGAVDILLVRDLDRLARELTVQEAVLAHIWRIPEAQVFTFLGEVLRDDPDDPMRTAMRQMAGVFAQLNRTHTVKLLRDARKAKARRGEHANGPAPFGWHTKEGDLIPVPAEQNVLASMRGLAAQGHTQTRIAAALNDARHTTREGAPWTQQHVSRVMHRDAARTPEQRDYQDERLTAHTG